MQIGNAESDEEIDHCFPVMAELRPHLERSGFVQRVRAMQEEGFRIAYLADDGRVRAVAGYRFMDMLFAGRTLYVDDLVTAQSARSRGYGGAMLAWLQQEARSNGCVTLTLDSGVHRSDAHRFYFRERMTIIGYHFSVPVEDAASTGAASSA